jgi:hypothetical protein
VSPYLRTVKTASGARAVQIVHSSHRRSRDIEHIGSAHDDAELELLKAVARQRLPAGQGELGLGPGFGGQGAGGPVPPSRSPLPGAAPKPAVTPPAGGRAAGRGTTQARRPRGTPGRRAGSNGHEPGRPGWHDVHDRVGVIGVDVVIAFFSNTP